MSTKKKVRKRKLKNSGNKLDTALHKRAFEYWYQDGISVDNIAKIQGMPIALTLGKWKRGEIQCKCHYHRWDKLKKDISDNAVMKQAELSIKNREKKAEEYAKVIEMLSGEERESAFLLKGLKRVLKDSLMQWVNNERSLPIRNLKEATEILATLVKTEKLLKGEATENIRTTITSAIDTQHREQDEFKEQLTIMTRLVNDQLKQKQAKVVDIE